MSGLDMPLVPALAGQAFDLRQGARLRILAVTDWGAVLLLEWTAFHARLPGGNLAVMRIYTLVFALYYAALYWRQSGASWHRITNTAV